MSEVSANEPSQTARACRPWGVWASIGWTLAAMGAWIGAQFLAGRFLVGWSGAISRAQSVDDIVRDALFISLVTICAAPAGIAVIVAAIKLARCSVREYLGLGRPRLRDIGLGLIAIFVLVPLLDAMSHLAGQEVTPQFVTGLYRSARDTGTVPLLFLAIAVAAPLVEEIVFRGFLVPGLAQRIGAVAAVLIAAAGWAMLHAQYEPFHLIQIVVLGSVFGWLRLKADSTSLVIVLHALVNSLALAQAAFIVERMG